MPELISTPKLLDAFPAVRSSEPEDVEVSIISTYGARKLALPPTGAGLDVHANHWQSPNVALSFCSYGANVQVEFPEAAFYRQQFGITGAAEDLIGGSWQGITANDSCVIPPETPLLTNFGPGFEQIVLRINAAALNAKLSALIGGAVSRKVVFESSTKGGSLSFVRLRRTVAYLARELEASRGAIPGAALSEMEQLLIVAFLLGNPSNYSALLEEPARTVESWQLRRVEEYIVAHWNEPITLEVISRATSISARTIFHHFKRARGMSPMDFVKRIRLERARDMLSRPETGVNVTEVAFACGFGNAGHFAGNYFRAFGERPSDTVKRGKVLKTRH